MARSKAADLLEQLSRIVPGIAGYQEREKTRDSDKAIREKAASAVVRCRERVAVAIADLSRTGSMADMKAIGALDRLSTRLEKLEDELRFASYGYKGFFHETGINEDDLARIYEYDLELLNEARNLEKLVPAQDASQEGGELWLADLEKGLETVNRSFRDRKKVFEG